MIDTKKYLIGKDAYDLTDKDKVISDKIDYAILKCQRMFKYKNLPESIPERNLEIYLQVNGSAIWMIHDDKLCIYTGGLGGEPDYLYRPTIATIANPYQNFNGSFKIQWDKDSDGDCIVMLNDVLAKGLMPMHRNFATQLAENELSIWLSDILSRMPWLLSAQDEKTKASAEEFLRNIFSAKLGVVTDSAFLDGIKEHVLSNSNHNTLNQLIILNQYLKSSWYNEIGLNAMQNGMKKEAISDSEEQMNQDILKPLLDEMLYERKKALDIINEKFADYLENEIKVDFASSWEDNKIETKLAQVEIVAEAEEAVNGSTENLVQVEDETMDEPQEEIEEEAPQTEEESEKDVELEEVIEEITEDIKDEEIE